jgi:hypothetical protein
MKYQMTCPKCRHEFTYDNGYYDKHIVRLGAEIQEITIWLAQYKLLPPAEKTKQKAYRDRLLVEKAEKQKDLSELKAIRKVCDQQIKHYEYTVFKELVKERYGEAVYKDLLEKTTAELAAYKASGLMRREYSRRGGGSVTSINKL